MDRKFKIIKRKIFASIITIYGTQELWRIQKGLEIYMENENPQLL